MSEFILLMGMARSDITKEIEKDASNYLIAPNVISHQVKVGKYRDMKSTDGDEVFIEYFNISSKGKITMMTSGLNSYFELTPVIRGGKVKEWHCYGRPENIVPRSCRKEKIITRQGI